MSNAKRFLRGRGLLQAVAVSLILLLAVVTASAQQTTGVPGSPSATTTIDGKYIPNPAPPFAGKINLSAVDSETGLASDHCAPQGRTQRVADHD